MKLIFKALSKLSVVELLVFHSGIGEIQFQNYVIKSAALYHLYYLCK